MTAALALQLIEALVGDFPALVADIKALIAALEGTPSPPAQPPLTVAADTAALDAQLDAAAQPKPNA